MKPRLKAAKWLWLVVLAIVLTACSSSSGGGGSASSVGGAAPPMPLPGGEQTRVAGSAPAKPKTQKTAAPQPQQPAAQNTAAAIPPLPGAGESGDNPPDPTQPPADTPTAVVINTPTPFPTVALTPEMIISEFSAQAADGLEITGSLYVTPRLEDKQPGVIILPMDSETRQAWDAYARVLAKGGYTVLVLDLRGQGETGGATDWQKAPGDVGLAWKEFTQHKNVEPGKTALVGAGSGANVALNAAAALPDVRTVVLISPTPGFGGLTTNEPLGILGGRKALVISGKNDPLSGDWSASMQALASGSIELELIDSAMYGTGLLGQNPYTINTIQKWLQDRFAPPPSGRNPRQGIIYLLAAGIFAVMSLAALLGVFTAGRSLVRNSQQQCPGVPVRDLQPGSPAINIRGMVKKEHSPVTLPVSGTAAISLEVDETRNNARMIKDTWYAALPFTLEDDSGEVLVEVHPGGLQIDANPKPLSAKEAKPLFEPLGVNGLDSDLAKYNFRLRRLDPGMEVTLTGKVIARHSMTPCTIQPAGRNKNTVAAPVLRTGLAASVQGIVTTVLAPLDGTPDRPLALRRLVVETVDPTKGRVIVFQDLQTSEFCLQIDQDGVWMVPNKDNLNLAIPERVVTRAEFEGLLVDKFIDNLEPAGRFRYLVYEVYAGDEMIVQGLTGEPKMVMIASKAEVEPAAPPLVPVSYLQNINGRVAVSGKVVNVENPLTIPQPGRKIAPLALMRIDSQEKTRQGTISHPPVCRASPFWIQDSTGMVRIIPTNPTGDCLGAGEALTAGNRRDAALRVLGVDPQSWSQRECSLWVIREGQEVTVHGNITTGNTHARGLPSIELAPSNQGAISRLRTWQPRASQVALFLMSSGLYLFLFSLAVLCLYQALNRF